MGTRARLDAVAKGPSFCRASNPGIPASSIVWCSTKGGGFLDQLSDYQLLKKNSAPRN